MDLVVSDSLCLYCNQVARESETLDIMETQKFEQLTRVNESLQAAIEEEKKKSRKIGIGVGVGGTLLSQIQI